MKVPGVMKPKRIEPRDIVRFENKGYIMEPKYDGYRTVITHHEDGTVTAQTRLGNDKTGNIPHIIQEVYGYFPPGTVLDGEVIFPKEQFVSDFTKVKMIMGSHPQEALRKQREMGRVVFVAFDILFKFEDDLRSWSWEARRELLAKTFDTYEPKYLRLSPQLGVSSETLDYLIGIGAEGIVIKDVKSDYHSDKRPTGHWYKIKYKDSIDAVVMGFEMADVVNSEGDPTWIAGLIGAVEFGQYKNGILIRRGKASGMDVDTRRDMTENPEKYVGQVVEIQHMGLTDKATRHPQFKRMREDKLPGECLWEV